jgi:hypothetical protein
VVNHLIALISSVKMDIDFSRTSGVTVATQFFCKAKIRPAQYSDFGTDLKHFMARSTGQDI